MSKTFYFGIPILAAMAAMSANANTLTYQLTVSGCSSNCGAGPYGTITIEDNGLGSGAYVSVMEQLDAGIFFAGTNAGNALSFELTKPGAADTILPTDFVQLANPGFTDIFHSSTFGSFNTSIDCTSCKGGQSTLSSLSFNLTATGGITTADFITNADHVFFTSDVVSNANTGNVASIGTFLPPNEVVPEPGTIIMLLSGFGLMGLGTIHRTRKSQMR